MSVTLRFGSGNNKRAALLLFGGSSFNAAALFKGPVRKKLASAKTETLARRRDSGVRERTRIDTMLAKTGGARPSEVFTGERRRTRAGVMEENQNGFVSQSEGTNPF